MTTRDEVLMFAGAMEATLQMHDKTKIGWSHLSREDLLEKLEEEYEELKYALCTRAPEGVIHESTDLANICMMIWNNEMEAQSVGKP